MAVDTSTQERAVVDFSASRWQRAWRESEPDDTLVSQFVNSQSEMNARIAMAAGGRALAIDGANVADAGSAVAYLNQAVLSRPAPRGDDLVYDEIEQFFENSQTTATLLSLWPTADLWHRGWVLYGHPVLVAKSPVQSVPRRPEGMDVEVVTDREGLLGASP